MHCSYCSHLNPDDEPRCQRCGRRLHASAARPAPGDYAGAYSTAATAAAPVLEQPAPSIETAPQGTQVPRQTRLFSQAESGNLLQFPSAPKAPEPKPRSRRQSEQASDSQAFLD